MTAAPGLAVPVVLLAHWSRIVQLCLGQSEQAVAEMLQALAELGPHVALSDSGPNRLARLYQGLQYQDRQRQSLEVLLADLQAASSLTAEQASALDMGSWLDHFDAACPIPELRRHRPAPAAPATPQEGDGLEFF